MVYLSIIIPAFNEEQRIPATLKAIKEFVDSQKYDTEVLVVDDGSMDATVQVCRQYREYFPELRVVSNSINKGKGEVVRQGMLAAQGHYRLFADADNSTPISELPKLLKFVSRYDVIIGSRYLDPTSIKVQQPFRRRLISRTANFVIRNFLLPGIYDTQCGFKLFSAKATEDIFSRQSMKGWSFDIELLTIAKQRKYTVKEVPVDWFDAKNSTFHASKNAGRFLKDLWELYKRVRVGFYQ